MASDHISPRVGNFLLMGLVGAIGTITVLAAAAWLAQRQIPVLSPIAESGLDLLPGH